MKKLVGTKTIGAISMALVLAIALPGCDRFRNLTAQEHVQRAKDFQSKGELRSAEIELKNALAKNPNIAEARLLLGEIYLDTEQGASAEKELLRAKSLGVSADSLALPLGRAYLSQGKFKEVMDDIKPGPNASNRYQAQLLKLRGDASIGLRKGQEACALYNEAKEKDPTYVDAYRGLALCASGLNKDEARATAYLEQAIQLLDAAIAKNPNDFESYLSKGEFLHATHATEKAREAFTKALGMRPNDIRPHLGLASLAIDQGDYDTARKQAEKALQIQPDNPSAIYTIALIEFGQGKFAAARDHLLKVLKLTPGNSAGATLLGITFYSLGDYEQARQILSNLLEFSPGNPLVRKMLAATLLKQNQPSQALDVLTPMLPNTSDTQIMSLAGEIHMAMKNPGKAVPYFEQVTKAAPTDAGNQIRLGVSQLQAGDINSGIAVLEQASRTNPKQLQSDAILISAYMQLGQYDKALSAIDTLAKKQPGSPIPAHLRGTVYLAKQDLARARNNFEQALGVDPTYMPSVSMLATLDMRDKNPEAARKRFEKVLDKDPKNVPAMLALADLAATEHKPDENLEWLNKAANADPKALEPKAKLVEYYLQKMDPQRALVLARNAQSGNDNNPLAWELLGRAQAATGEKENAVASFTRQAQLTPQSPAALTNLGRALMATGNLTNAGTTLRKALSLDPDFIDARGALASIAVQQDKIADALKLAEEQIQRQPKSPVGSELEGDIYMTQKNYPQAVKAYTLAFALGKSSILAVKLHQAMGFSGNLKNADAQMMAWLQSHPDDASAQGYFADTLISRGKYQDAITHYESALKIAPDNAIFLNNLAEAYSAVGDPRAKATAEQALKLAPNHPGPQDTLGWMLVKEGKLDRALELLKSAATAAPNSPAIRYHYGVALARSGKKGDARRELTAALRSGQKFPQQEDAKALLQSL